MLILLEDACIELLYKTLLDKNFSNVIYQQKRETLIIYLRNLGVKYIEI